MLSLGCVAETRREPIGLLAAPPKQLFEAPNLRLHPAGHHSRSLSVHQNDVDDTSRGVDDRDLKLDTPSRVQCSEEGFDHRRLESVVQTRPGTREVSNAEIRSKRDADRRQDLDTRVSSACLDPRQMRLVDPGGGRDGPE